MGRATSKGNEVKDETPFRCTQAEIRTQLVVTCCPIMHYQLEWGEMKDEMRTRCSLTRIWISEPCYLSVHGDSHHLVSKSFQKTNTSIKFHPSQHCTMLLICWILWRFSNIIWFIVLRVHWTGYLQPPGHHFNDVKVGECKINSSVWGSYVAEVSKPLINVPKMK